MMNNGISIYREEGKQNLKRHETDQRCINGRDVWYLNAGALSSDYASSFTPAFSSFSFGSYKRTRDNCTTRG